jgi:hypothetical protein
MHHQRENSREKRNSRCSDLANMGRSRAAPLQRQEKI